MMNNKHFDIKYWLDLSLTEGIGYRTLSRLLQVFESPAGILTAATAELARHVPARIAENIHAGGREKKIAETLKWSKENGCHILTLADADYPSLLLETGDAPPVLYLRGNRELLDRPLVAVIGSRNASNPGLQNTEIFARALSDAGIGVVSGMAQGVDAAAHRGALAGPTGTIAVVGTGLDVVYPKINRPLAAEIVQRGLMISEFPLGTSPMPQHFPRRNRIISGLSQVCLVMEATLKSGSLITARYAAEQGREVFAVPGSINAPMHRGCHALIKQGASLAENVNDILTALHLPELSPQNAATQAEDVPAASTPDGDILPFINFEPTSIDNIATRSGIPTDDLLPELLELEMNGKIVSMAGGRYQRIS